MASSSESNSWKYDVFLSFRGEDTRKTFVDHLYSALKQQGIHTYKDDETLDRGEVIGSALKKAIRESRIAVIVFSENYAESSWCLDELEYIMKCRDEIGQVVMPIFYHVDPSDVRKQKRKYGEAFLKHELKDKQKVETWRKALAGAGNIAGWETKYIANGHESKGIKEIVDSVFDKLPINSDISEEFVGLRTRLQHLKSQLDIESGGVRIVGIWGVGGGGKTTLAECVYTEISSKFDGCCFIDNIREKSNKDGLQKLQEKVISDVLKKEVKVGSLVEGKNMIKKRLSNSNVLIVLDDVDHLDQLEALAGSHKWFGEGSRIIITTRDNHLLNAHKVNAMHDISLLSNDEASKLFRKHAPQGNMPLEDYEHFSKEVVSYAGGLPLALKVLGCFLCDKEKNEWTSALTRLKEIPDNDILRILKISFDGLGKTEKELFLDIACFYRRKPKKEVIKILDACGFHPVIGIKMLIEKALITVNGNGMFDMHDLVEEMGHYIVRGGHPKICEKHSRVWKEENVRKICAMGATMELDNIEAIQYRTNSKDPLRCEVIGNMRKLRLVDLKDLRGSSLPIDFISGELCCLLLGGSGQRQLWEGPKALANLTYIRLSFMKNLITTPDISGLPNLQTFILWSCLNLEEIHPSFGHSENLVHLEIEDCRNLKRFPPINMSKKLHTLLIRGFTHVRNRFHREQSNEEPEPSLPHNCIGFPPLIHYGLTLTTQLHRLDLCFCGLKDDNIGSVFGELPNLQQLNLRGNYFTRFDFSMLFQLPQLKFLDVSYCHHLMELLNIPSSIAVLIADACPFLESIGDISNYKCLWKLSLAQLYHTEGAFVDREITANTMLQGNAIKQDHYLSLALPYPYLATKFVDRFIRRGERFTLQLPGKNLCDDFYGFRICIVTRVHYPIFKITLKPEMGKDFQSEVWQESTYEAPKYSRSSNTYVGYVPLKLLQRHTPWWNSMCNRISISVVIKKSILFSKDVEISFGGELVPRKSKGDVMQTTKVATDYFEFWDERYEDKKTFTIKSESNSSITIEWRPFEHLL